MTYLLDINVLVTRFDAAHAHHEAAHRWFAAVGMVRVPRDVVEIIPA